MKIIKIVEKTDAKGVDEVLRKYSAYRRGGKDLVSFETEFRINGDKIEVRLIVEIDNDGRRIKLVPRLEENSGDDYELEIGPEEISLSDPLATKKLDVYLSNANKEFREIVREIKQM